MYSPYVGCVCVVCGNYRGICREEKAVIKGKEACNYRNYIVITGE